MFSTLRTAPTLGDTIRTQLERQYEKYTGPLFFYDEDVFVDKAGKTCVFLLKDEDGDTFLYFLDMVTYASIKGNGVKRENTASRITKGASSGGGAAFHFA